MGNRKWNKLIIVLFFALAIINPILDILRSTTINSVEIFGISLIELSNYLIVFVLALATMVLNRKRIKTPYKLIAILLLLIYSTYIFLHCINVMLFDERIYYQAKINVFKEIYYIFRMYILPLFIVWIIYINRTLFNEKVMKRILTIVIIEYCLFTILPNLFHVAFVAYKQDNTYITHNFLEWFTYSQNEFIMLTSKGWFYSANSLSAILLALLMLNYLYFYKNPNIERFLLCFFQILAMIMIGTKTAVYGSLIISVFCYIFFLFESIYKKNTYLKKTSINFFLLLIALIPFYLYSPLVKPKFNNVLESINDRINIFNENIDKNNLEEPLNEDKKENTQPNEEEQNYVNDDNSEQNIVNNPDNKNENDKFENNDSNNVPIEDNDNNENINLENIIFTEENVFEIGKIIGKECNKEKVNKFLKTESNIYWYKLLPFFLDNYSVNENPNFWCNVLLEGRVLVRDYRTFKVSINKAIVDSNNNIFDKYLGVGYTANLIDPETDLYYIYFNFGILGLLLFFGPYVILLIYCFLQILLNIKTKYNLENFVLGGSFGILILLTHLSGHVLNKTSSAILMACLAGALISLVNKENI